ncbi:orotate phosphoribosyltransferase [Guggenheimella bovis]
MNYKREFIEFLLASNVLTFGDFTTKSGRKTPYFLNFGNIKSGSALSGIGRYYAENYKAHFNGNHVLYGPAYKGIPLAVSTSIALSDTYNLDVTFNRKEVKDHGEGGVFVGKKLEANDSIVIVEDVITAGTAIRETLALLEPYNVKVDGILIGVDRMEKGTTDQSAIEEIEELLKIKVYPVVTIREIIKDLYNRKVNGKVYIDDEMKERIEAYLALYGTERAKNGEN